MNIGIIGAGNIGATLAWLLAEAGYNVAISNSRGPQTLADLADGMGPRVQAMTAAEAAAFGDVIVEAIPYGRYQSLPAQPLAGKILISAANYYPGRDGDIDMQGKTHTDLIAAYLPETRVVKGFNTIWSEHLAKQGDTSLPTGRRRAIFIAGDDADAKQVVSALIEAIGFGPVDTGLLSNSSIQEPGTKIYNVDLTVDEARALLKE